jgi:molecular chaperone DnaJ
MTTKADYYTVLEVQRDASADEVKRAFRRLAMQYHPDRNSEPGAEARFKEINEAYEVLSDPERRATYDRFGHAGLDGQMGGSRGFEGFGPFGGFGDIFDAFFGAATQARRRAPSRGADLQVGLELSFEEAAFGTAKSIIINRTELCTTCNGLRAEPGTEPERCATCEGTGEVRRVQRSVFGQFINVGVCDRCRGEGLIVKSPCKHCRGTGRERVTRTIEVKVPAGVDNGSQVRLTGEGELGSYGGPRGSTYVVLNVGDHKVFERYEDDLHVQLNLSFAQAALGDEVHVPVLEPPAEGDTKAARDTTQTLQIKAGTESGEVITIRGKGVPHLRASGRGDLHVHVQVRTPKKLSKEQKDLLEKLAKTMDEGSSGGKGIFEKIKDALG